MEPLSKSATILTIIPVLAFLLLSGCADTRWPTWLTGEPDDSVLTAPRVVGTPLSAQDTSYPNLATVPEKPKDFTSKNVRQEMIGVMQDDKAEAEEIKERLEALPDAGAPSSQPSVLGTLPKAAP